MILNLVSPSSKILHTPTIRYEFGSPDVPDPNQLARDLCDTMLAHGGVGISANQVGLPWSVFVIKNKAGEPFYALFNPNVVSVSDEQIFFEEGCLSFPDLYVRVKRPVSCRIRFQLPSGVMTTKPFEGGLARIALHEYSHMLGKTMIDDANYINKDRAKRQWKALERKHSKEYA